MHLLHSIDLRIKAVAMAVLKRTLRQIWDFFVPATLCDHLVRGLQELQPAVSPCFAQLFNQRRHPAPWM